MNCLTENELAGFVDGALAEAERRLVEAHLGACARCCALAAAAGAERARRDTMSAGRRSAPDQASSPLQALDTFDRYTVVEPLGHGGMGQVYRARDTRLGRDVALKILSAAAMARASDGGARLLREARAAAALAHPNVVQIHDTGVHDGVAFIAMEYVPGTTLRAAVLGGTTDRARRLAWLLDLANVLAYAHRNGIVHRDVKPENVMIREDGVLKVLDFGLARRPPGGSLDAHAPHLSVLTQKGAFVGTPAYMPPEQFFGEQIDARADQFAWGVVAYEVLAGRRPWGSNGIAELADRLRSPATPLPDDVPEPWRSVVDRTLAMEKEQRFASMDALVGALGAREARLPEPGDVLAEKYRVEALVGRGGMGVVYRAQHEILAQPVAIKLMLPEIAQDAEAVARFLNEARSAARIQNEHVTRVMDVGRLPGGLPYIVMELLAGSDLSAHLMKDGPLPVAAGVDYVLQALEAIAEAHALGIVHRDLKPSNLLLTRAEDGTPRVKVLDFGISKSRGPEGVGTTGVVTGTSAVLGSPSYMSPEQLRCSRDVDARADVWGLGVTLYELLSGEVPFRAETPGGIFAAILERDPLPLSTRRPEIPDGLDQVILRCLRRAPDERWPSVLDLARALEPFGSDAGTVSYGRVSRILAPAAHAMTAPADARLEVSTIPPGSAGTWQAATGAGGDRRRTRWTLGGAAVLAASAALLGTALMRPNARATAVAPPAEASLQTIGDGAFRETTRPGAPRDVVAPPVPFATAPALSAPAPVEARARTSGDASTTPSVAPALGTRHRAAATDAARSQKLPPSPAASSAQPGLDTLLDRH